MYCSNCGKKIPDDSTFCPFCGSKVMGLEDADEELAGDAQPDKADGTWERAAKALTSDLDATRPITDGWDKAMASDASGQRNPGAYGHRANDPDATQRIARGLEDNLTGYEDSARYAYGADETDDMGIDDSEPYSQKDRYHFQENASSKKSGRQYRKDGYSGRRPSRFDDDDEENDQKGHSGLLIGGLVVGIAVIFLIAVFMVKGGFSGSFLKKTESTASSSVTSPAESAATSKSESSKAASVTAAGEKTTYDPFSKITIKFNGKNGEGTISVDKSGADGMTKEMQFTADKTSGLKNGDVVNVSLSKASQKLCHEKYNVEPVVSQAFMVSGLTEEAAAPTATPIPTATPTTVPTIVPTQTPAATQAPSSGAQDPSNHDYVFSDSSTRIIGEDEVRNLPANWIWIAKNEIYAREGRIFDNADLQAYFESKSWYSGYITREQWDANGGDEAYLNSVELKNAHMMAKYTG